ncbi:MAG: energy transducer TonB [Saprospiraceae bacterium]
MNKSIITILMLSVTIIVSAQTSKTKYFMDAGEFHEVPISKAVYSQTITSFADGTVTTEIKNYKTNEIIRTETYRGEEPFGVWTFKQKDKRIELNYDFELIYSDHKCLDTIVGVSNYFENNASLHYIAPVDSIAGFTMYSFLYSKIRYPAKARENGISGQVILSFTITKEGNVEDIIVLRGANILLDKEAVRVIRQLSFSNPGMLDGKPVKICVKLPVKYVLG